MYKFFRNLIISTVILICWIILYQVKLNVHAWSFTGVLTSIAGGSINSTDTTIPFSVSLNGSQTDGSQITIYVTDSIDSGDVDGMPFNGPIAISAGQTGWGGAVTLGSTFSSYTWDTLWFHVIVSDWISEILWYGWQEIVFSTGGWCGSGCSGSSGFAISWSTINSINATGYLISFMFDGILSSGDVATIQAIDASGIILSYSYIGIGGETGYLTTIDASSLIDWSVTLSGHVINSWWNLISWSFVTNIVSKDTIPPTVTLTGNVENGTIINSWDSVAVTITFSESSMMSCSSGDDVTITNGIISGFTCGGGFTRIFTVIATGGSPMTIWVATWAFTDSAGNPNITWSNILSFPVDDGTRNAAIVSITGGLLTYTWISYAPTIIFQSPATGTDTAKIYISISDISWNVDTATGWSSSRWFDMMTPSWSFWIWEASLSFASTFSSYTWDTLYLHVFLNASEWGTTGYAMQAITFIPNSWGECSGECGPMRQDIYSGISNILTSQGIENSLNEVDGGNVENFTGLYFKREWYGSIEFLTWLDLTNSGVQDFLQALSGYITMNNGYVEFNPIGSGEAFNVSATISMNFDLLPFIGTWSADNIIVKDSEWNITGNDMIGEVTCAEDIEIGNTCSFITEHFTSFWFKPSLPYVHIWSDAWTGVWSGDTVYLAFTSSEPLTGLTVMIEGNAATFSWWGSTGGTERTFSKVLTGEWMSWIHLSFTILYSDYYGNSGDMVTSTTDESFVQFLGEMDWTAVYTDIWNNLAASGINNNLTWVISGNVDNFTGLYFAKMDWTGEIGRITFATWLDLTNMETQMFLSQDLRHALNINQWQVWLNPWAGFIGKNATLQMNLSDNYSWFLDSMDSDDFVVKDSEWNITGNDMITNVYTQTCSEGGSDFACSLFLDIDHFTEFALKPFLMSVHIHSNHGTGAGSWDTINVDFFSNDALNIVSVTIAWNTAIVTTGEWGNWIAEYTLTGDGPEGEIIPFTIDFINLPWNSGNQVTWTTDWSYIQYYNSESSDSIPPTVTLVSPMSWQLFNTWTTHHIYNVADDAESVNCTFYWSGDSHSFTWVTPGTWIDAWFLTNSDGTRRWYISCIDQAGNTWTSATQTFTIDTTPPTVSITGSLSEETLISGATIITVSWILSEVSPDFNSGDITITNGTMSSRDYAGTGFTCEVTPTTGGIMTIQIWSETFSDTSDNPNITGSNILYYTVDITAPTAYITYSINHTVKQHDTLIISATFDEDILITNAPGITMTFTGTDIPYQIQSAMVRNDATHYYYNLDVPEGDGTGTITFRCNGTCAADLAGNPIINTPTSGDTFNVDNTAPTATVTYTPSSPTSGNVVATLTESSESITGLDPTSITFTDNGTWLFTFYDLAGNTGTTTATVTWIDTTTPTFSWILSWGAYYNSVTIFFSGDNLSWAIISGLDNSYYNDNYTSATTITPIGKFIFTVYDTAWNNTGAVFFIENTPPTVSTWYVSAGTTGANGWNLYYIGTITIRAEVSDNVWLSGTTCMYTTGSTRATATYNTTYCEVTELTPNDTINIRFRIADLTNQTTIWETGTYIYDTTAPSDWSFTINNNATYATGTAVILDTTCPTDAWVWWVQVAFGDSAEPTNRQSCSSSMWQTLSTGDATKTVYMRFRDSFGNMTSDTTDTIILDTTAPTATVNYVPSSLTSGNVIATLTGYIETITGTLAHTFTGNGTYIFNFQDLAGNTGTVTATVDWIDKTTPVIILYGSSLINLEINNPYTELGAYRTDNDSTGAVSIISWSVNTWIEWTYVLQYLYSDWLQTWSIDRTVTVVPDASVPVITLNNSATLTLEIYSTYTEQGAVWSDNGSTWEVLIISGSVNTWAVGIYTLIYYYSDGFQTWSATRTITVEDTSTPYIALNNSATITLEIYSQYIEQWAIRYDNGFTWTVEIISWSVNTWAVGIYIIQYTYSDGFQTWSATRTVTIVDTTAPTASTILYSITWFTNQNVIATLTGFSEAITGLNPTSITFTGNGTWTFVFYDLAGNTGTATASVDWIDKTTPTASVIYDISIPTSSNVTATLTWASETITITNNSWSSHIFTWNGTFTFNFIDNFGNTWSTTATVDWIDITPPSIYFSNNIEEGPVTSDTISVDWGDATIKWWMYNASTGCSTHFSDYTYDASIVSMDQTGETNNEKYICIYAADAVYNNTELASAYPINIDITPPTVPTTGIIYTPSSLTSWNVVVTLTGFSEAITGLNPTSITFTNNGTWLFTFYDLAGNTGTATASVDWIDKTAPTATVIYTPSSLTSGNVVATLTGFSETITGTLTHTFTGNGTYIFNFQDLAGNTGTATASVDWIDKTAPTATVIYTPSSLTSGNVVATLTGYIETITGTLTHTFTGNGTYIFNFQDLAGNTWSTTATVDWIDTTAPTATVIYTPSSLTSGNVVATLTGYSETWVTITNNSWSATYTFTNTWTFTFTFSDVIGNTWSTTATVTRIDKIAPTATGSFSTTALTNGTVTVTLTGYSENLTWINTTSHLFTWNGSYIFTFSDLAGNTGSYTAIVSNIDTTDPTVTKLWSWINDYSLTAGSTGGLIFSESISNTGQIQSALTFWANFWPTYNRAGNTLIITANASGTSWDNDVSINVYDMAGNASNLLLIDSVINTGQLEWSGEVTMATGETQVVIGTNDTIINIPEGVTDATIFVPVSNFWDNVVATVPEITLNVTTSIWLVNVEIPDGTTITTSGDWNGTIVVPTVKLNSSVTPTTVAGKTNTVNSVIEIWFTGGRLTFDKAVRILIPGQVGKKAGYTVAWSSFTEITNTCSSDSQSAWDSLDADSECKIDVTPNLVIWTKHFTTFATYTQTTDSSNNPWGGGWGSTPKDTCPNWDLSLNLYDGICTATTWATITTTWSINWSTFSNELNNAYLYAYSIGITTMPTIQQANIEGNLIRAHMAKMMVNYAIKVLGKTLNTWALCEFNDIANQSTEMKLYIKLSCQLGLMGQWITDFNPNGTVTRAQFGTVLSRAIRGDEYNMTGNIYYTNHLQALKDNNIITNTNPELKELRWYVMLMLMRAAE